MIRRALICLLVATPLLAATTPALAIAPAAAPAGLTTKTAMNGVQLFWNSVPGATSYELHRGASAGSLSLLTTTTQPVYGDKISPSTTVGTSYVYEVRAVNADGASPLSAPVTGTTPAVETVPTATSVAVLDAGTATEIVKPVTLTGGDRLLNLAAEGLLIQVSPPEGSLLQVGTMQIGRFPDATKGGLYYAGSQVGCLNGTETGTVTINSVGVDVQGVARVADADATVTCGSVTHQLALRVGTDRPYTAVTIPAVDAGKVAVGSTASAVSTYTNSGTSNVSVTDAAVSGGTWAINSSTCSAATLTPGQSCQVAVKATPAAGTDAGTITYTDSTGSHTRALTASGVTTPVKPTLGNVTRAGGKVTFQIDNQGGTDAQAASYRVLEGPNTGALTEVSVIPATGPYTKFTDPRTTDDFRVYEVEAINVAGTSAPSEPLMLDLGLRQPTAVVGTATVSKTLLSWTAPSGIPSDPITGYAIYRGTTAAALSKVSTSQAPTWTGPAPAAGTHGFFAVAALTANGEGPRSTVVDLVGTTTQLIIGQASEKDELRIAALPLSGGPAVNVLNDGHLHLDIAVQANGTYMAYSSAALGPNGIGKRDIFMRKIDGTTAAAQIATSGYDEYNPAWSPDGKQISYSREDGTICRATVTSTGAGPCIPITQEGYDDASWLNATTLVAADYSDGRMPLVKLTTAGVATTIAGTTGGYLPSVSPDGTQVAFVAPGPGDFSDVVKVVNLATGAVRTLPSPGNRMISTPSWTRDQSAVYFVAADFDSSMIVRSSTLADGAISNVANNIGDHFAVAVSTPDLTAPVSVKLAGVPAVTLGTTVTPTFSAGDALNKVASYSLSYRRAAFNGAYSAPTVKVLTKTTPIAVAPGYSYCFSVRATDRAGNTSAATSEQCVMVPLDDRSLARSSGFTPVANRAYYAGTAMKATAKGQTLTRTGMTAIRQLTVIASTCPTCGVVDVYVGSARVGSVNTASRTTVNRKVFTLPAFSVRSGTVQLKVASTGKQVVVDGLGFRK